MKKILALIILIVIALAGCGNKDEQKGQTTGTATPPPAQVTMDSIAPATRQTLAELMEHNVAGLHRNGAKGGSRQLFAPRKKHGRHRYPTPKRSVTLKRTNPDRILNRINQGFAGVGWTKLAN